MILGIRPTADIVFKRLFGFPENSNLTLSFLNSVLPLAGRSKATSIEILNPWRLSEFSRDKEIVVDVRARDESERDFQIEIQVKPDPAPFDRMLDNWARLFTAQLGKGERYANHRPVISLWILDHALFPGKAWFHPIEAYDGASMDRVSEKFLIIVIELGKRSLLPDFDERAILKPGIDEWLYFLAKGDSLDSESSAVRNATQEIQEAMEIMKVFTNSDRARYAYQKRMDYIWSERDRLAAAKQEGLTEGRAEGLAEGRAEGVAEGLADGKLEERREIASRMKTDGLAIEIIEKATGLSKDEILAL